MKILSGNLLSTLTLSAALTSIASAQPAAEFQPGRQQVGPLHVEFTAPAEPPLPVSEAKKRYREKQKNLEELAKGRWIHEDVRDVHQNQLETLVRVDDIAQEPRDRMRAAVAEAFDARRQLQQAELTELENRIARIKRALEIRDAMRDTIIDQRTDELLDEIQDGPKDRKSGSQDVAPPTTRGETNPGARDGATSAPEKTGAQTSDADRRLIDLDALQAAEEASADVARAQRALEYSKRMHSKGFVAAEDVDAKASELRRATLKVDRAKRLVELDLQEAEAGYAAAKKAFSRVEKLHSTGAASQEVFDEAEDKYRRAQIQLERARVRLESLATPPKSDGPPAESITTSSDLGRVDQPRIVWSKTVGSLQLGWDIEPMKVAYKPGDVLTVGLVIRNIGDQPIEVDSPPSNSLERMGLDLTLVSVDGEKLRWEWGPAHKDRDNLKPLQRFRGRFAPGGAYEFPSFRLSIGEPADASVARDLMGGLDVKAGQTARLSFKLSSVVAAGDNAIELQSEPFEFHVEEPGARR